MSNTEEKRTGGSGRRIGGKLLFENKFTITKERYQEFIRASSQKFRRIYYIIGSISLVFAVLTFVGSGINSSITFFMMAILCYILPRTMNPYRKGQYEGQVAKNEGKPLERRVLFYEDGVEVFANNGSHSVYGYEDITNMLFSKSMYAMVMQKKLSVLVMKDSFTQGSLEEWKAFMAGKVKWKIR